MLGAALGMDVGTDVVGAVVGTDVVGMDVGTDVVGADVGADVGASDHVRALYAAVTSACDIAPM